MAINASWNGISFEASPALVRSFKDLQLTASCETDTKKTGSEQWLALKEQKPYELTLTTHIDARTGSTDVQGEAESILRKAHNGESGAFMVAGRPVMPTSAGSGYSFICTQAAVTGVEMLSNGRWLACDIKLTLKSACNNTGGTEADSDKKGGGGGGGGGGSKKSSGKSSSKKKSSGSTGTLLSENAGYQATKDKAAYDEAVKKNKALKAAKKATDTAKKQSSSSKKSPNRAKSVLDSGPTNWAR